jgi:purine-nucleoside phosphorylase
MSDHLEQIILARDYIWSRSTVRPQLAAILGSGLGSLADELEVDAVIPYGDIPGFPESTVTGHAGQLVLGELEGKNVVMMRGRFHFYEGHPMPKIVFPIRVLVALGARMLIVTNSAGGLNPDFEPGDVMLISDHINAMGTNALIGPNEDAIGPRFPDMTHSYAQDLQALTKHIANRMGIPLRLGVYAAVSGPTYETRAERRFLRIIGGDAVGMSTVPEVTAANHAGMRILGLSAITNKATGDVDQEPDNHEDVLAMAQVAGKKLVQLVRSVINAVPVIEYMNPADLVELIAREPDMVADVIDHTLLKPDATSQQIKQLCEEALEYEFASICINPIHVRYAVGLLEDSPVKVGTVVGFPLGAVTVEDKIREAKQAIDDGATEVDMVINIGAVKEGNDALVGREIASVVNTAHSRGVLCKVIIEAGLLEDDEKERISLLAKKAGADYVKTSTGFIAGGATVEDVMLMRKTVGPHMGVKAAGGIRTYDRLKQMVSAGANRIGTSTSVAIMEEISAEK